MVSSLFGSIEQLGIAINRLVGGYDTRVRKGLVKTGDALIKFIEESDFTVDKKSSKKLKKFVRKWKADRDNIR